VPKFALRFGCAKQSKNLKRYLLHMMQTIVSKFTQEMYDNQLSFEIVSVMKYIAISRTICPTISLNRETFAHGNSYRYIFCKKKAVKFSLLRSPESFGYSKQH
jgi:hypothetical protein